LSLIIKKPSPLLALLNFIIIIITILYTKKQKKTEKMPELVPRKIAFLGLGAMGFGMATNLVKVGWEVTGYDVYGPTLERFVDAGGKRAETCREVSAVCCCCYCCCCFYSSFSVLCGEKRDSRMGGRRGQKKL
jgi:phosphoglycerate dehydrogenase-like enzyme